MKDSEAETFLKQIIKAEQVFVSGKGRSGFVANSFAMRLNQLGKGAHVVGESTTPSITEKDMFLSFQGQVRQSI